MTNPLVSVCLTAYKRERAIRGTIESILSQTFGDFELIIADDASPDGTEAVCRQYERLDRRVRYFRQSANVNMPENLNSAIRRASAPLIANLHDGDIYRPDLLAKWKAALDLQVDAAFVFNSYILLDDHEHIVGMMSTGLPTRFETDELVGYMLGPAQCFNSPVWGTVMGRAACYSEVGGFDSRFGFVSDVDLWLRLNARFPVAFVDEPLITLHQREADRPGAFVNWHLERCIADIYREAVLRRYDFGDRRADTLLAMQRALEARWTARLGSCLVRGRLDRAEEGVALLREQKSRVLRASAVGGALILRLLRSLPIADRGLHVVGDIVRRIRSR